MIFVLDFDGVLFDDKRFKRDFQHIFVRHGVSRNAYEHAYNQAKNDKKGTYELGVHLRILQSKYPNIRLEDLRRDVIILASRARHYLFTDAKGFLERAEKNGDTLFLLSTGDHDLQEAKIKASGIAPLFREVIIIASSRKTEQLSAIKKRAGRKKIIFVDDKKEVVDEIKKRHAKIRVIQMVRSARAEQSVFADARVKNFFDLKIFG